MEWVTTTFGVFLLLLLRVAIPIVVTIAFVALLKRLDERWKREAELDGNQSMKVGNIGCWQIHECPEAKRLGCKAYNHPDQPCWQVFRDGSGRLQERCLGCDIFRQAPTPVSI